MAELKRGKKLQFCRGYYLFVGEQIGSLTKYIGNTIIADPDSRLLQPIAGPQI